MLVSAYFRDGKTCIAKKDLYFDSKTGFALGAAEEDSERAMDLLEPISFCHLESFSVLLSWQHGPTVV